MGVVTSQTQWLTNQYRTTSIFKILIKKKEEKKKKKEEEKEKKKKEEREEKINQHHKKKTKTKLTAQKIWEIE
ncbi:hypothetical protein M8J77_021832 [Diaphorina citri]|nr:hypothetical protein M8J77_021832 [Diaphorina citri]